MAVKRRKKRLINKFIQVFLTTFSLIMILIGIGTVIFVVLSQKNISQPLASSNFSLTDYSGNQAVNGETVDNPFGDKKLTTFAVFGVDRDGYRTDVTMIVFFNHETANIDVISVPRDTQVKIPDEIYATIKARRSDVNQVIKINEVPAYVLEDRNETSVAVLEQSLGIDIDYYLNMDLDGFRDIVDAIDGVPMNIEKAIKYSDPEQELFIDLPAGQQTLQGSHAEWLVRFRADYIDGDLGRIEVQHTFMKAFVEQLLTTKNRLNMLSILNTVMLSVDTDFENAVDYLYYLDKITADNVHMYRLPGKADNTSRSYYVYDYDETKTLLNQIINTAYVEEDEDNNQAGDGDTATSTNDGTQQGTEVPEPVVDVVPDVIIDSKNLTISVQNGTNISGYAGGVKEKLLADGFKVVEATNYESKDVATTIIQVPDEQVYEVLKEYFKSPEMVIKPAMMDEEMQIIIVLGTSDAPQ